MRIISIQHIRYIQLYDNINDAKESLSREKIYLHTIRTICTMSVATNLANPSPVCLRTLNTRSRDTTPLCVVIETELLPASSILIAGQMGCKSLAGQ